MWFPPPIFNTAEMLPLSEDTKLALQAWNTQFRRGAVAEEGWKSEAERVAHLHTGRLLRDRIQAELGPDYEVILV